MDSKPKRKGRPLLVAAAGVAFVSFVQCEPKDHPVGNLRPAPEIDAGPPVEIDSGPAPAPDAGAPPAAPDAGRITLPLLHPVGNLRPPPAK